MNNNDDLAILLKFWINKERGQSNSENIHACLILVLVNYIVLLQLLRLFKINSQKSDMKTDNLAYFVQKLDNMVHLRILSFLTATVWMPLLNTSWKCTACPHCLALYWEEPDWPFLGLVSAAMPLTTKFPLVSDTKPRRPQCCGRLLESVMTLERTELGVNPTWISLRKGNHHATYPPTINWIMSENTLILSVKYIKCQIYQNK